MLSPLPNLLLKFVSTISKEQVLDLSVKIKRSLTYLKSSPQWIATASIFKDPNPDNKSATSEGIFVFTSSRPTVCIGDAIQVSGTVAEFRPGGDFNNLTTTQITSPAITILLRDNALPATRIGAGDRTPPTDVIFPSGVFFYESLEGMRVTAQDAVAVSPTNIWANSSELWAVLDQGAGATGINSRGGITISPNDFNPERIQIDDRLFTNFSNPPVNVGDLLGDITGVIGYGFGNYQFLVTGKGGLGNP